MELIFRKLSANEMERPPTQRDQFDNDDVELVDALVRESVQNSLDAYDPTRAKIVRVCFDIKRVDSKERTKVYEFLRATELNSHLLATNLPELDEADDLSILTVEDFGTTGLTGRWDGWDEKPFCDFWRRMGRSHKSGQSLGRWGLGKLVFSSSSKVRVFLGMTVRDDDAGALLMGQAVLTHHSLPDGSRLDSHAFYAVRGEEDFQLPDRSAEINKEFRDLFGLHRTSEPGLSIVVPALRDNITCERIAQGVIRNYFFPILFGRLEVHVSDLIINRHSFSGMAEKIDMEHFSGGHLAAFIQDMKATRDPGFTAPLVLPPDWHKKGMDEILGDRLELMREQFNEGVTVMVRAPVFLKRKNGDEFPSFVDAFLKRSDSDNLSLFVRHAIVLSAEQKYFKARKTFGALIADDNAVAEFLGDAENPAHTGWSASAEKVAAKWRAVPEKLRNIRGLLRSLHNVLVSAVETVEKDALVNLFSLPSEDGSRGSAPKGSGESSVGVPVIETNPRMYHLIRLTDGFKLQGGTVADDDLPVVIRVRVAYDVLRGNPFKKHSQLDFDFMKKDIHIEHSGAEVSASAANVLRIEVLNSGFEVGVSGFDSNRDLIVDVERVS